MAFEPASTSIAFSASGWSSSTTGHSSGLYFNKRGGWYQVFLEEPRGVLQVGDREIPIRAKRSRGERLMDAIDAAYAAKFPTPGSQKWVKGFATASRRARTLELTPR